MDKLCFKDYIKCLDDKFLTKTRRRANSKSYKKRVYGGVPGDQSGTGDALSEFAAAMPGNWSRQVIASVEAAKPILRGEEEQERTVGPPKIDLARQLFQGMINRPNVTRADIIQAFMDRIGVTHSTAVSYYERLAKEAGLTKGKGKEDLGLSAAGMKKDSNKKVLKPKQLKQSMTSLDTMEPDQEDQDFYRDIDDTVDKRAGIIRTVPDAHLVFKKQSPDGTYEELWIYNIKQDMRDELKIRRSILAGTDIPPGKTRSKDGKQQYTLTTMGNAQLLHITGLPN